MQTSETMTVPTAKRRIRMAADLLWFASASLGAGLLAAIVAAALVMLLAQPSYSNEPPDRNGIGSAATSR